MSVQLSHAERKWNRLFDDPAVSDVTSPSDETTASAKKGREYLYPDHNPFSVRFVQPGAVPFLFDREWINRLREKESAAFHRYYIEAIAGGQEISTWIGCSFLADRFRAVSLRAQIIGPHGSGKSTLMESLRPVLEDRGFLVFSWSLHDRQRYLPGEFWENLKIFLRDMTEEESRAERWNADETSRENATGADGERRIIFLDGFEQLSIINRLLFRTFCRNRGLGFLLSSHSPVLGLPVLIRNVPSVLLLRRVVDYLLDNGDFLPSHEELDSLYLRNRGNFRKILFDLYDRFEESSWNG